MLNGWGIPCLLYTSAGIFEWDSSASKFEGALNEGEEFVVGEEFTDMGDSKGGFAKVSMCFAISENTEHPAECAALINFLLNEEDGVKIMASERGIPASAAGLKLSLIHISSFPASFICSPSSHEIR